MDPFGQYGFREFIGFLSETEAAGFAVIGQTVFEVWATPYLLKTGQAKWDVTSRTTHLASRLLP